MSYEDDMPCLCDCGTIIDHSDMNPCWKCDKLVCDECYVHSANKCHSCVEYIPETQIKVEVGKHSFVTTLKEIGFDADLCAEIDGEDDLAERIREEVYAVKESKS